jgi:hypothetical protein
LARAACKEAVFASGHHTNYDLKTGQSVPGWAPLKKKGDFVLDFYLPAEHFYSFPFKVSVLPAANAFSGEDWWVTEGDWDKLGVTCLFG